MCILHCSSDAYRQLWTTDYKGIRSARRFWVAIGSFEIPDFDPDALDGEDTVEDHLTIERIESGALYFPGVVGPLAVSEQASALAKVGWKVYASLIHFAGTWWLNEAGNVYSM